MTKENQFSTFYLDGLYFGVEVEQVQEVLRYHELTSVPLAPFTVSGLINLRGKVVAAMDLRRRLNMKDREKDKLPMNVVVRTNNGVVSLLVDKIGDVLNVKGDAFETPPDNIDETTRELIKGIYKLKDQLLLILDTQEATSIATTDVSSN